METTVSNAVARVPWNKDKLTGQKSPLKLKEIWAIRIRLQLGARTRDLAMFNLAIDSKLRACDLTKLRVRDVCLGPRVALRGRGRPSCSRKRSGRCNSRSPSRHATVWKAGSRPQRCLHPTSCFRVESMRRRIFQPGSTQESSIAGSNRSGLTTRLTGPTRCVAQKRH